MLNVSEMNRSCTLCMRSRFHYLPFMTADSELRLHVCVCHFCGKPFEEEGGKLKDAIMAKCKICKDFQMLNDDEEVAFCLECGRDRRIARAPRTVNTDKLNSLTHFHTLIGSIPTAVVPCARTTNKCCCDGARLILLMERDIPGLQKELSNGEKWVYQQYSLRDHAHHVAHEYLEAGFGRHYPPGVNAICVLMLVIRAIAWQIAVSEGSPQHFSVIANRLIRRHKSGLQTIYENIATREKQDLDIILQNAPSSGELRSGFLDTAATLVSDDVLRLFIQGYHYSRGQSDTGDKISEGEHGRITLEDAVERIVDMAKKANRPPSNVHGFLMTIFQTEMAAYTRGDCTDKVATSDKGGFSIEEAYMEYPSGLFTFLWGAGSRANFSPIACEYQLENEPDDLFKTVQYLIEDTWENTGKKSQTWQNTRPTEEKSQTWQNTRPTGEESQTWENARPTAERPKINEALIKQTYQDMMRKRDDDSYLVKPPGIDPLTDKQYSFLRNTVVYEAEIPGTTSYENSMTLKMEKLQHHPKGGDPVNQDFDDFIESLTSSPCADEVMHFVSRHFYETYAFPNAYADTPQELVKLCIDYMYKTPVSITFNIHTWFIPSIPSAPKTKSFFQRFHKRKNWETHYPAENFAEYKACFLLPQTERLMGDIVGEITLTPEAETILENARERAALKNMKDLNLILTDQEKRRLRSLNEAFDGLDPEQQSRVTEAYQHRDEQLRTYPVKVEYGKAREGQYNRWRREKDERITEYRNLTPQELPIYAALNFDIHKTGGWVGHRAIGNEYLYYGTGHFILDDSVKRRSVFKVRSKDVARKNMLLVLADLVKENKDKKYNEMVNVIVANAVEDSALYQNRSAECFVENIIMGPIRFKEDVNYLIAPCEFPEERYRNLCNGALSANDLNNLAKALTDNVSSFSFRTVTWKDFVANPTGEVYKGNIPLPLMGQIAKAMGKELSQKLRAAIRDATTREILQPLARKLTRDTFCFLVGYSSSSYTENITNFCKTHDIKPVFLDPYFDPPCDFKPNTDKPIADPTDTTVVSVRREPQRPFWEHVEV